MAEYVSIFILIFLVGALLLEICFDPRVTAKKDASSRTINRSYNCTNGEVQTYSLGENYVLTEVSTNSSSRNTTLAVFLDNLVQ